MVRKILLLFFVLLSVGQARAAGFPEINTPEKPCGISFSF